MGTKKINIDEKEQVKEEQVSKEEQVAKIKQMADEEVAALNCLTKDKNIFERLALVCERVGAIQKGAKVAIGGGGYSAITESDVLKAVNVAEKEFRVKSYLKDIEIIDQHYVNLQSNYTTWHFVRVKAIVEVVNLDNINEKVQFVGLGDGWDVGDKASNKAQTYALKYALLKGYKIVSGDDGDYFASVDNLTRTELIDLLVNAIDTGYKEEEKRKNTYERLFARYKVASVEDLSRIQLIDACKRMEISL